MSLTIGCTQNNVMVSAYLTSFMSPTKALSSKLYDILWCQTFEKNGVLQKKCTTSFIFLLCFVNWKRKISKDIFRWVLKWNYLHSSLEARLYLGEWIVTKYVLENARYFSYKHETYGVFIWWYSEAMRFE